MRVRSRSAEMILSSIVLVSACAAAPGDSAAPESKSAASPAAAGTAATPPAVIERARRALREAGLSPDAQLAESEPMQWNDSSLGCRRPGESYLQVITSGYALRFLDQGRTHEVHVAGEAAVICEPSLGGAPKRPGEARRAQGLEMLTERARNDLATRLGIPVEEVKLQDFTAVTWPDGGLGCNLPHNGRNEPLPGYKLKLGARGGSFLYHTDLIAVFACPPIEKE
jgi:hypothetical protein